MKKETRTKVDMRRASERRFEMIDYTQKKLAMNKSMENDVVSVGFQI